MFAMINLGPILITMAVVAGLVAVVAIGLVVAAVVAVRRVVRRRAALRGNRVRPGHGATAG